MDIKNDSLNIKGCCFSDIKNMILPPKLDLSTFKLLPNTNLDEGIQIPSIRLKQVSENIHFLPSARTHRTQVNDDDNSETIEEVEVSNRKIKVNTSTLKLIGCEIKRKQTQKSLYKNKLLQESNNSLMIIEDNNSIILMTEESECNVSSRSCKCQNLKSEEIEVFNNLISKYYYDISDNYQGNFEEYVVNNLTIISYFGPLLSKVGSPSLTNTQLDMLSKFSRAKKTLILDLDETLIHSDLNSDLTSYDAQLNLQMEGVAQCKIRICIRPSITEFLEYARKYFNVVVFTASLKEYADLILDYLDPEKKYFSMRLYRESCTEFENLFIKDLNIIGIDLKDVIIVDNCIFSFSLNIKNGVLITSFYTDTEDSELLNLIDYLEKLRLAEDVRDLNEDYFGLETINNFLLEKLIKEGILTSNNNN